MLLLLFVNTFMKIFGVFNEGGNKKKTPCSDTSTDSMPPKINYLKNYCYYFARFVYLPLGHLNNSYL